MGERLATRLGRAPGTGLETLEHGTLLDESTVHDEIVGRDVVVVLGVGDRAVERLGDEYRLITLTLPGQGLTGPNANHDYSIKGMSEAVDLVVDELGLDHFVLGGNSMGGWLTWRGGVEHPDRVNGLVLINDGNAQFTSVSMEESGISIPGDGKSMVKLFTQTDKLVAIIIYAF